jgi:hypothetical protein
MVGLSTLLGRVNRSGFLTCAFQAGGKKKGIGGSNERAYCVGLVEGAFGKDLVDYMNMLGYLAFGHMARDAPTAKSAARIPVGLNEDKKGKIVHVTNIVEVAVD